jgi:hypothetical protein
VTSLFCRHNRFTADCSICSRGTVLESGSGRSSAAGGRRSARRARDGRSAPRAGRGYPCAEVGPYEDEEAGRYTVRLERVPGGLRLAEWAGGLLRRRAPRLRRTDAPTLIEAATARELLQGPQAEAARAATAKLATAGASGRGASPGRSGELDDELRVEPLSDGELVRVARWVRRPGTGWEMLEAPVMLPAGRYVEALVSAGRHAGTPVDAARD